MHKGINGGAAGSASDIVNFGSIWLQAEDGRKMPFLNEVKGSQVLTLANQLATDLGRPLRTGERGDW